MSGRVVHFDFDQMTETVFESQRSIPIKRVMRSSEAPVWSREVSCGCWEDYDEAAAEVLERHRVQGPHDFYVHSANTHVLFRFDLERMSVRNVDNATEQALRRTDPPGPDARVSSRRKEPVGVPFPHRGEHETPADTLQTLATWRMGGDSGWVDCPESMSRVLEARFLAGDCEAIVTLDDADVCSYNLFTMQQESASIPLSRIPAPQSGTNPAVGWEFETPDGRWQAYPPMLASSMDTALQQGLLILVVQSVDGTVTHYYDMSSAVESAVELNLTRKFRRTGELTATDGPPREERNGQEVAARHPASTSIPGESLRWLEEVTVVWMKQDGGGWVAFPDPVADEIERHFANGREAFYQQWGDESPLLYYDFEVMQEVDVVSQAHFEIKRVAI